MKLIGVGITALLVYIISILIINIFLKRKMAEAMMWSFFIVLIIGSSFSENRAIDLFREAFKYASTQEVVYASMAFVFMAYLMDITGVINRLVNILNSLLGKLPGGSGYVSTIGSALFGLVSGSGSGNASAVGSITIPWMRETGWSVERATMIVAGNAGLGMIFPPSSSMLLLLGMENIAGELDSGVLFTGLLGAGLLILAYRLFLVYCYAKKDGLKPVPDDQIMPFSEAVKKNGSSLIIFLGVIIPIVIKMGPLSEIIKVRINSGAEGAFKSISIVFWIPILISIFTIIEGKQYLPKNLKGWNQLIIDSVGKFKEVGCLLFFAFAASRVLILLGLENEFTSIFTILGGYSKFLVIIVIIITITMMVGPFTGTATTTALGSLSYAALRSIGVSPVASAVAFLNLISNEGCIPPNSAPIYIASGISGLDEPSKIFKNLILHYAIPTMLIAMLIMMNVIPVIGG